MIPHRNLDLQQGMRTLEMINMWRNIKDFFILKITKYYLNKNILFVGHT
jgi:hypothetical protein